MELSSMSDTSFTYDMRVHYKDTDQMGVAHHANYISWFEIARTEMMRSEGVAYKDMEDLGLLLPVLDVHVQYRKPAHYDDLLTITTSITSFSPARFEFSYEVRRNQEDSKGEVSSEVLATGTSLHMWLNKDWKPARLHKVAPDVYEMLKNKYGN